MVFVPHLESPFMTWRVCSWCSGCLLILCDCLLQKNSYQMWRAKSITWFCIVRSKITESHTECIQTTHANIYNGRIFIHFYSKNKITMNSSFLLLFEPCSCMYYVYVILIWWCFYKHVLYMFCGCVVFVYVV